MKLSESEIAVLNKLIELAKVKNPVEVSLRNLEVEIKSKRWSYRWLKRKASHMAIRTLTRKLQKKGLITLDYSDRWHPKIIVNILEVDKGNK